MNSANLINPLSPQEYCAWKRWLFITSSSVAVATLFLLIVTIHHSWQLYGLKKKVLFLQKNSATSTSQNHELLRVQHQEVKKKLKEIKQWNRSYYFKDHLEALSTTIPFNSVLVSLYFDDDGALIKGQTLALEFLLDFLSKLEQTHLFQSMNLTELQPSSDLYREKKLVNFTIKGKLIK